MRKKTALHPGTVFRVPLRHNKGFALGVLTRSSGAGTMFGYFYGRDDWEPEESQPLRPEDAILVGKFGDLELVRGNWPVLGTIPNWDGRNWPLPPLGRVDESCGKAWLSTYDDRLRFMGETAVTPEEARKYPADRQMGAGAVEIRLTNLTTGG